LLKSSSLSGSTSIMTTYRYVASSAIVPTLLCDALSVSHGERV
jgi:hypothetical protein